MKYGYARVSSVGQNLNSQIKELKSYVVDELITEKVSGASAKKIRQQELLEKLREGDLVVVTRLDRLGRNTIQLLELVEDFKNRGIGLYVIKEGIDTRTTAGTLMITLLSALAELERSRLLERQQEGIAIAKEKGVYKGRVKKYTLKSDSVKHAIELRETTNKTVKEISNITGISIASFYRIYNEYKTISSGGGKLHDT